MGNLYYVMLLDWSDSGGTKEKNMFVCFLKKALWSKTNTEFKCQGNKEDKEET